jgi:poly(hydroxyalkanoate) depolymerase family esterase
MLLGLLAAAPAWAGYAKVAQSDWQQAVTGLPTYVNMYAYVPTTVASKPPIVVYCHHCQGDAASSHSSMASLEKLADSNGFIIIYPEATGENCWDAGSVRSLKHGGGGDTGAVVQMVKYALSKYSGDAGRVYVSGDSSGGIMTEALLGVYPDVFMAGVSIMGVPCGCWGDGYNDVTGKPSSGTGQWSGSCAGGTVVKTAAQWGELVRSYFPGYTGHRPRLQHWHGATDSTLNYKNVAEDIKEWTNLLALSETPTGTEQNTPKSGTTHQFWKNSCYTVYETFVLANTGHTVSLDGPTLAAYFGIDKAGGTDPETAACPGAVPGGATGAGGAGGASGSGGATGAGTGGGSGGGRDAGVSGSGGGLGTGGRSSPDGAQAGGATGSGGATASAGGSGAGGASTNAGGSGSGGVSGSGGAGGSTAVAGSSGGSGGSGPTSSVGSGGNSGKGGASGGTPGGGGAGGEGGSPGSGSTAPHSNGGSSGCAIGSHASSAGAALLLLAMMLVFRPRRRSRR